MGVYFVLDEQLSRLKVGMVQKDENLRRRYQQLNTGRTYTEKLRKLGYISSFSYKEEALFHVFLKSKGIHVVGEWFEFTWQTSLWLVDLLDYFENDSSAHLCEEQLSRSWKAFRIPNSNSHYFLK